MALFRGIQEYIALDANNITLVFDSGNIVNISGNIFLYPPQAHPILYNNFLHCRSRQTMHFLFISICEPIAIWMRTLYCMAYDGRDPSFL